MDAAEFHDLRKLGRAQLLADFPLTANGLRLPGRAGPLLYLWLAGVAVIGLAVPTILGIWFAAPLVFPPLASSALMVTSQSQRLNAHPRAVMLGHGCGVVAGLTAVTVLRQSHQTGVLDQPTWIHGVAALLSVTLCIVLMAIVGVVHAPAMSTTLMIGLGLIVGVSNIVVLLVGAALLTITVGIVHRIAGVDYPWWASRPSAKLPVPAPES